METDPKLGPASWHASMRSAADAGLHMQTATTQVSAKVRTAIYQEFI